LYKDLFMKKSAHTCIEAIDNAIRQQKSGGNGIINGKESKLLYYYELFRATGKESYKARLYEVCRELSAELRYSAVDSNHSLSGLAGILWLFCQLREDGFDTGTSETDTAFFNEQLVNNALLFMGNRKPGYMEGAYGVLYYLLLCEQTPAVKEYAGKILKKITDDYIEGDIYSAFKSNYNGSGDKQELDLGLYHGLSGNLMVLLSACRLGYQKQNVLVEKLLKDGVKFILHHKMDIDYEDECYSFFPPVVKKSSNFLETSNSLAWVNSDLNHILLLYEMHLLTGETHYRDIADDIGLQTIARKQFDETLVDNSSFINGSSGIAMFYKKLSIYGNTREYLDAFHYWTERTMVHLDEDIEKEAYAPSQLGVLNGLIGVSLTLLAYSYDDMLPKWTKLFFL
jgi:lantibiotic biosynthesis protein